MSSEERTVYNGRYELHRRLARGGMADVFLARDQLLDRPVAVKVLFAQFAADPAFVERFRREAQASANLNHPNIVGVYDWGETDGTYFIVMEYVEGRSLAEILRAEGPLHPDRAADVAADVAAALGFAHRNGVVHRDVKPGNILISPSGQVKVTDFGIARALTGGTDENLTQTGSVMGTATYFSPEQAQGHDVDPRSDLYSLGVVLFELLVGRPPFKGDSPVAIAYKHVQDAPPRPGDIDPSLPPAIEAITLKCLAKKPQHRYPSAEDLRSDLRRFREGAIVQSSAIAASAANAGVDPPTTVNQPPTTAVPAATRAQPAAVGYQDGSPADELPYDDFRPRSGGYLVALVVLLALVGGGLWLLASSLNLFEDTTISRVTVPDVTGLDQDAARSRLEAEGFEVTIEQEESDEEVGLVIDQDPKGESLADSESEVTLTVSAGMTPIELPDVVGDDVDDATDQLEALGFQVEAFIESSDDVERNRIIAQSPGPGEAAEGTTVQLRVSGGPAAIEIPVTRGQSPLAAANALGRAGFETDQASAPSDDVPAGEVINTDPAAGQSASKGSTVTIIVSTGPEGVPVPNVIGNEEDQARSKITGADLEVSVERCRVNPGDQTGIVKTQSPGAGTRVDKGDTVTITVSSFALFNDFCPGVDADPDPTTTTSTSVEDPPPDP